MARTRRLTASDTICNVTDRTLPDNARLVPDTAECVFRGKIYSVYQWEQELFDGTSTTFEMLKRTDTVVIIALLDDDTVLVEDEEQPGGIVRHGNVPLGQVDANDPSVLVAAQRELSEETGYHFKHWHLLNVHQPESKIEWFVHTFVATGVLDHGAQHLDAGERISVRHQPFTEFAPAYAEKYGKASFPFTTAAELRTYAVN